MNVEKNVHSICKSVYLLNRRHNDQLAGLTSVIKDKIDLVASLASTSDYGHLEANGYRATLFTVQAMFRFILDERYDFNRTRNLLGLIDWTLKCTLMCLTSDDHNVTLGTLSLADSLRAVEEYKTFKDDTSAIYGKFIEPFAGNSKYLVGVPTTLALISQLDSLQQLFQFATDGQYRQSLMKQFLGSSSLMALRGSLDFMDDKRVLALTTLMNRVTHYDIDVQDVMVQVSSQWDLEIVDTTVTLKPKMAAEARQIRCKVYRNKCRPVGEKRRQAVLHLHGGAFTAMSPDSHEGYLVEYSRQLADAVIVSVDYSLSPEHKFPGGLRDALDVYLWLTRESQDYCDLSAGRLVLTGDCAGGGLALSLVDVLTDLRSQWTSFSDLLLPARAVLVYPLLAFEPLFGPSVISSWLTSPMVSPATMTAITAAYSPIKVARDEDWAQLVALHQHPYISPLHVNSVKMRDLRLAIVTSNTDPFLDQSIALARNWAHKENLTLDIVDRLPHGFLHIGALCGHSRQAIDTVIGLLKQ
ncbi:Hormone-sensitive lipase [Halotydeus destructor]|nr:Hormone-sensitive lipase [Halotydeus destructor]